MHVDTAFTWRGGEAQALMLARGLAERGHEILFVCQPGSVISERSKPLDIKVVELRMLGEFDLLAVARLSQIIKSFHPEVIHLHDSHAHALGGLAGRITGAGLIVVSRRVDFPVNIKWNFLKRKKYLSLTNHFIAVSNRVREELIAAGISEEKVSVVYSGIDLGKFRNLGSSDYVYDEFGMRRGEFLIGSVAALAPHKDHITFLRAAKQVLDRFPQSRFILVGEGELEGELKREVKDLSISESVIFTGFRKDVGNIVSILDIFVISSYLEGLCTSLLDAMLLGIPIVATDVGGIPEIIHNGVNGILVPPRDPKALADAICHLLSDEGLRGSLSESGRRVVKNFDIGRTITLTESLYRRLIAGMRTPQGAVYVS